MAEDEKEKGRIVYVLPLDAVIGQLEMMKQQMMNIARPIEIEAKEAEPDAGR